MYDDPDSGLMSYYGKGRPNNSEKESRDKQQEDCSPEVRKQINQLRKDLKFDNKSKLVLLLSIASDEMIRMCMMNPEVFYMDVTANTNRQKRDLFVLCVKDSLGKSYPVNITVIPSGKKWVFHTIYSSSFCLLYGEKTISCNRLAITDEDVSEYSTFES